MTKFLAILLSSFVLSQSVNIDLTDIVQLDELIAHAQFHNKEYGDGFFVFISKHYGKLKEEHSKKHQEEREDHEQLPFSHQSCTHIFTVFVLIQTDVELPKVTAVADTVSHFFYQESYSFLERSDIFQPPRYS